MKLRENIEIFKHFKKYSEDDGIFMIKIIKKASKSQFFYHNLDILLSHAKSFDRMALKEVADLPMNNMIVSKAAEDKRTKTRILPRILEKYGMERKKELPQQQTMIFNKKLAQEKHKEEELLEKAIQNHTKNHTYQKDFKLERESESEKSYDIGKKVLTEGNNRLPVLQKLNIKNKSRSRGKNEKNLIIIVRKRAFFVKLI